MHRRFVVVSGLPGSGKSTLAQQLAPALGLPLLDKDDILERLFESKGAGDADWHRTLSRESDRILQAEALASSGAVLVSHWRLPGMPMDSGTPTGWLGELSAKAVARVVARVINVHCHCDTALAAERFVRRTRHPGHLDREKTPSQIRAGIQRLAGFGRLRIQPRVDVDTTQPVTLDGLLPEVLQAFQVTE
jgi:ABC-type cobalamin/Fe3+-siderophores transport system ATPase subunit